MPQNKKKISFTPDSEPINFTPDNEATLESFNTNDVIKLKPYQMPGYVEFTGPEVPINPITQRPESEGFWSKALNLPEARKPENREDNVIFKTGIDYGKVGDYISGHLPEGKTGKVAGWVGSALAGLPEAILSDPTSPALGLAGAGKGMLRKAELKTRLENIRNQSVDALPEPTKFKLKLDENGKLTPARGLLTPEEQTSQATIRFLEGKPLEYIKPAEARVDFTPSVVTKVEEVKPVSKAAARKEAKAELLASEVDNSAGVVSDSVAERLKRLASQFTDESPTLNQAVIDQGKPVAIKGVPPDMRAKIFRGKHDPVDVIFNSPFDREVFGARMKLGKAGSVEKFNFVTSKIVLKLDIAEKDARGIIFDYNQKIRDLTKSQPPKFNGGIGRVTAPSLDDFISESRPSLLKRLISDTEGSLKPKELVENTKKVLLKLRGKTPDEVSTIRQELVDALSTKRRIDTKQLYSLVEGKLSQRQFERVLIDLLDSGEIEKSVKRVPKVNQAPLPANVHEAQSPEQAIDILLNNLKSHTTARIEQDALVSTERKSRIREASKITDGGMEGYFQQLSKLKGKYPVVKAEIQQQLMNPENVNVISDMIKNHPGLSDWDKIGAQGALAKVAGIKKSRGALQPDEIEDLTKVFGERATQQLAELHSGLHLPPQFKSWEEFKKLGGDAKSLLASADFPGIFRAGINYTGQKEWRQSVLPALKSYFSKAHADDVLGKLKSDKMYEWAHSNGLAITDYKNHNPLKREESISSLRVAKLPWVAASNRGQTVFADVLRFEKFKSLHAKYDELYKSMKKTAKTPEELAKIEELNPLSEYRAGKIADEINTASGRGRLSGKLEASASDFNALFFSPRLMSARMRSINRILNPVMYAKYNPIERKEALRQLFSISSILGSTMAYSKLAGGSTSFNAISTDFLKPKIGDTRMDALGGYQQLIVPIIRKLMGGKASSSGKISTFGDYGVGDAVDVAEGFLENKASPFLGLAMAIVNRQEMTGEALDFRSLNPMKNTATKHLAVPLIAQDIYDMFTHDPSLMQTFAIIPSSLGLGAATYNSSDNSEGKLKAKQERKIRKERLERIFGSGSKS